MEKKEALLKKINEIGIWRLVIMIIAGIVLVIFSMPSDNNKKQPAPVTGEVEDKSGKDTYVDDMEARLKEALSKVSGIGNIDVMITVKGSKEMIINKDTPVDQEEITEEDSGGGKRNSSKLSKKEETVLITDSNGKNVPYVIKEIEPEISGVVVIAEGGDNEKVISEITEAVEVLFSVPVHRIKVMKMKQAN